MSEHPAKPTGRGRDLLLATLAVHRGFVDHRMLTEALRSLARDDPRSVAEVLQGRGSLSAERREELETLVDEQQRRDGGDLERSLATLGLTTTDGFAFDLDSIADPELRAGLSQLIGSQTARELEAEGGRALVPWRSGKGTWSAMIPNGRKLGRFEVIRPHARGGLGEVSLALDTELNREVALKQIQPRHADSPDSRGRFVLEAEITGNLEHPGIVPVYSLGRDENGRPFYAMRFIRGDSLKEAIDRYHFQAEHQPESRLLELQKLLRRFLDVCNAVAYAHSRGVLHRDIKPANVLVGAYGETLLVDWGLAKVIGTPEDSTEQAVQTSTGSGSSDTLPGSAIGTPAYMSPEQARGDLGNLGPTTDVYSLGATLYCLLTGRAPFQGKSEEVLPRVQTGDFRPPRRLNSSVPRPLEAICLKAMALRPEDRYQSADALADDLVHWLADEPISAWREPISLRAGRWARRHRQKVTAAAVLLVTLGLSLSIGSIVVLRLRATIAAEQANAAAARRQRESETRSLRYSQSVGAIREREDLRPGWTGRALATLAEAARLDTPIRDLVELRTEAARCLASVDLRARPPVAEGVGADCLAFHPDGQWLAVAESKAARWVACRVLIVDVASGAVVHELSVLARPINRTPGRLLGNYVQDGIRAVAFSPDGRWLVAGTRSGYLLRWDLGRGEPAAPVSWLAHGATIEQILFSPSGDRVISRATDHSVRAWSPADDWKEGPALPDGRSLAVATAAPAGRPWLFRAAGGSVIPHDPRTLAALDPIEVGSGGRLACTADGRFLALEQNGSIAVIGVESGRVALRIGEGESDPIHEGGLTGLGFSPDGTLLASSCALDRDRRIKLWDASDGRLLRVLEVGGTSPLTVTFSPDGTLLGSTADFESMLYELTGRSLVGVVGLQADPIGATVLMPDHQTLATLTRPTPAEEGGFERRVTLWPLEGGSPLAELEIPDNGELSRAPGLSAHPDPESTALAIGGYPGTPARLWCPTDPEPVRPFEGSPGKVIYSPDGARIWGVSDECKLTGWTADSLRPGGVWDNGLADRFSGLSTIKTLAPGRRLVAAGTRDGKVVLLDAADASFRKAWKPLGGPITAVALSPDEGVIAAADQTGRFALIHCEDGSVERFEGHSSPVVSFAFGLDGWNLFTASVNGSIRLWRRSSSDRGLTPILTLAEPGGQIESIALDPTGGRLAVLGKRSRAVHVWQLDQLRASLERLGLGW